MPGEDKDEDGNRVVGRGGGYGMGDRTTTASLPRWQYRLCRPAGAGQEVEGSHLTPWLLILR